MHQKLMPGHEKPTAGASEVARRKIVAHPLAPLASPSLDRIKICCEDKMVPLRVGAWPKMPIRWAQIFGETAVSLMNSCLVFYDAGRYTRRGFYLSCRPS